MTARTPQLPPILRGPSYRAPNYGTPNYRSPSRLRRAAALAGAASLALGLLTIVPSEARAQAADPKDYPSRPVKFIVPFPPGGAIDTLARMTAASLSTRWQQPVTVENRPGAGGIIGTEALAKAAPDGLTFGWGAVGTHGINAGLYKKLPYDTIKDFAPVAPVAIVPNLLVVNANVPAQNAQELIALLKKEPGKYSYASAGSGTTLHISCELFKHLAGVDMLHIPYKGSGPALTDVLGGQVPIMCDSITSALPHLKSGKLRALGITSSKRSSILPDVPTLAEAGVKGYEMNPWFGVFAPPGTPAPIVDKVNADIRSMMAQPDIQVRLRDMGAEPMNASPAEFAAMVKGDVEKWGGLVRGMGITAD